MELFAKQIVNDLKPFQGLWLFSGCKFSPLQRERYFRSNGQWCSKNLSSKSSKNTCEEVDFLWSFRRGIYSFTKNELIHRCSPRILVAHSAGSFTESHFQVQVLLSIFCGTKRCLLFSILKTPHPPPPHPFLNGGSNYSNYVHCTFTATFIKRCF